MPAGTDDQAGAGSEAHHDEVVDLGPGPDPVEEDLADTEQLLADVVEQGAEVGEPLDLASVVAERDDYFHRLQLLTADFENFRKRTIRDQEKSITQAAGRVVESLLPVLDACAAAVDQGAVDVEPIHKSLFEALEKEGLEVLDPVGQPFDPHLHEAVMHEEGDGGETVVAESLRVGYVWKGQVLRPAMVKVRG